MKKCIYGCGQTAQFQLKNGNWCCSKSPNSCAINRKKNSKKIQEAHKNGKYPTDCFGMSRGWRKGLKKDISELKSKSWIRIRLIQEIKNCEKCGISKWDGKKIELEVHHIDGNKFNNKKNNLQLLCPNCHSQTNNFRRSSPNGENGKTQ